VNKYHALALCMLTHSVNGMEKKNDWDAEKYQRNSELQFNAAMRVLSNIEFKGDEKVLDIGCGDGRVTAEIAKKVPYGSVKGIDKSQEMVRYARSTHQQSNLGFDALDISDIKYPYQVVGEHGYHNAYNLVTAFSSLSWVKDQQEAFKNIAFLLVYRGKVRAGLAHEDSAYLRARFSMQTHDKWKEFFIDYEIPFYPANEEKIRAWLKTARLTEELVEKKEVPHLFKNRQEFINWMSAIPAQIDRIPEERHEEFFNDIIDEYFKEVPQEEDGSIKLSISALVVRAEYVPPLKEVSQKEDGSIEVSISS
jgi:trans-aconitate 2-methyltransferase